jgi:hypothetical protein
MSQEGSAGNNPIIWPLFFPLGCPPEESHPATGTVYRLVDSNPPGSRDFLSHRERWPKRKFNESECIVCGVSVYTDKIDIERLRRTVPAMRSKLVALGVLNPALGSIQRTPRATGVSHVTWWIPEGSQPWILFRCVS